MFRKIFTCIALLPLLAVGLLAQGPDTPAAKDDWEEINFDFNSSVLVDGFPSLLRVAELMKKNPTYRLTVEGNTDEIGGRGYNEQLGLARANAVRDFLVRRGGAAVSQITTSSAADTKPKTRSFKKGYSPTDEARFMNRRVVLTVFDQNGKRIGDASDIVANGCCNDVLKKLDKLDEIERLLRQVVAQNNDLKAELDQVKARGDKTGAEVDEMDPRLKRVEDKVDTLLARNGGGGGGVVNNNNNGNGGNGANGTNGTNGAPGGLSPEAVKEIAKATNDEHERRNPNFEMLGLNVGPTGDGTATFTGKGRFFHPIGEHFALQSEAEYFYSKGQEEGQFDFGGVERLNQFQVGLFGSVKHVNLAGDQTGGTLGQAALTVDYIFKYGKIGAYGTKAFLNDALVNSTPLLSTGGASGLPAGAILNQIFTDTYLHVVDSAGVNVTAPLFGANYFEGNVGYLKSEAYGDRLGGTLRLIFPFKDTPLAFTLEGGVNETLLSRGNTGRVVVGIELGNFQKPKELLTAGHAVPVQIPRVRYETITKIRRTGNDAPVANAGPNQTFTAATTVTLDGSQSYDPNGDPITFLWQQDGGPAVTLSSPTSAITTFAAAGGQTYRFRLTVKDPSGATGIANTMVTTGGPVIVSFTATPASGNTPATLSWNVTNADTVTITGLSTGNGSVPLQGTASVTPGSTTVYTLTATKGSVSVTATASVVLAAPVIVSFSAQPNGVTTTQGSTLSWNVTGADTVRISGVGAVVAKGSTVVTPSTTTTYILTATKGSLSVSATVTVTVTYAPPKITSFTSSSQGQIAGTPITLTCTATAATSLNIAGINVTGSTGSVTVTPYLNTQYTCTATGPTGAQAQQTIQETVVEPAFRQVR